MPWLKYIGLFCAFGVAALGVLWLVLVLTMIFAYWWTGIVC